MLMNVALNWPAAQLIPTVITLMGPMIAEAVTRHVLAVWAADQLVVKNVHVVTD